jgi:alpha-tubulin suppressor-like RCC1 family protein
MEKGWTILRSLVARCALVALVVALAMLASVPSDPAEGAAPEGVTTTGFAGRIATGGSQSCAVTTGGSAYCWGDNDYGQLGDGTFTDSSVPVQVCAGAGCAVPLTGVKAIGTGAIHTCALLAGGTVKCWGYGIEGQLGDGTTLLPGWRNTPTTVTGLDDVKQIAVGTFHACALVADGRVRCWGNGGDGEMGTGPTAPESNPLPVAVCATTGCPAELSGIAAISAGGDHTCALSSFGGLVYCWGGGSAVGNGTTGVSWLPVNVCGDPGCTFYLSGVSQIAAGGGQTCSVMQDGSPRCWGDNGYGQLGDGTTVTRTTPVVVSGGLAVSSINTGGAQTCATVSGGQVRCWGRNDHGELGNGALVDSTTPVLVCSASGCGSPLEGAATVAAGSHHACVITGDGRVLCWGSADDGRLGNGTTSGAAAIPVEPSALPSVGARSVAPGDKHACALTGDGNVQCWGYNASGQLGNGTFTDSTAPVPLFGANLRAAQISAGLFHSCNAPAASNPRCWGEGDDGRLGNGSSADAVTPQVVDGSNATQLAAGSHHACGAAASGLVRCWGRGENGRLGNGSTADASSAVSACSDATCTAFLNADHVDSGDAHTCARLADGTVKCWGYNAARQLGDHTTTDRTTPVLVKDGGGVFNAVDVLEVATGGIHSCALVVDGTVRCWGSNGFGQLGNAGCGSPCNYSTVTGLTGAIGVTSGFFHSCALLVDGVVKCWGANGFGQLGNGLTLNSTTPATVSLPRPAVAVNAGTSDTTCAVLDDGRIFCWGRNESGQAGDGTTVSPKTSPVPSILDSDGDGVRDQQEAGGNHQDGGQRDPFNPWDFFDVTGDGSIDLSDALDVLGYFGNPAPDGSPADLRDRDAMDAAQIWRTSESDTGVDLTDALNNLASFGDNSS